MTGEVAGFAGAGLRIGTGQLEAIKWVAVVLMLQEHVFRYVLDSLPGWSYLLGRLVFPLFVFAFAYGLWGAPWSKVRAVLARMFAWALASQLAMLLVEVPEARLNVLFTFGFGLLAVYAIACGGAWWRTAAMFAPVLALGHFCEFGLIGVAFVFAVVWLSRAGWASLPGWVLVVLLLLAVAIPNGTWFAVLAAPVLLGVVYVDWRIPRLRGMFYWVYAGQFPAFAALRAVLS